MVLKRQFRDHEDEIPSRESKRGVTFATIGRDLMKGLPSHEFLVKLEPFLRSVVREEVERSIVLFQHSSPRSSLESSQAREWQLHFIDRIPSTLFTGNKLESVDSKPIRLVIRDVVSKKVITYGPLSSIKIEILVLDGDFGSDDQEDWTENEFKANLVKEREGKKPLIIGELKLTLREGVGYIGEVFFTDNSSWIRSRKFRLGARIVPGGCDEVRIREARSESFVVKDHRGESYKKHHPPSMDDEIWRLEKIAKDGAFHKRLAAKGVTTVMELLRLYHIDSSHLRHVLGGGISNKTWETIIEHANACVVDEKLYVFNKDAISLVFNSAFKAVGVIFDGQNCQSLDKLNEYQMRLVENLKSQAYKNLSSWVLLDESSTFGPVMLSPSQLADPYSSPSSGLDHVNLPGFQHDQLEMQSIPNIMTSPPYASSFQDGSQLEGLNPTPRSNFTATNVFSGLYAENNSQIGHLVTDDRSQFNASPWQGNEFFLAPPNNGLLGIVSSNFGIDMSRRGNPKARWCMIRAAMTWGISVRRDVAAKRMATPFYAELLGYSY